MSVIDEIKDRLDMVEFVSETVKLRKSGKNYTGFCPFHPNTRTPAFVVFPESGTWRCFGACNEGGDVFKFVMKKEGWDFKEALNYLAGRAGVELSPRSPESDAVDEAQERLRQLLETAVTFYRHNLQHTPAGEPVLTYLLGRGLRLETLESFEIGYAPDSWEETLGYLLEKGYEESEAVDAGMVAERDSGGLYDRFRHRIMIPIRDARGRMVGFGARAVVPEGLPKYLNSPQTALFDKGKLLYGLDKARKAIRSAEQAVLVEGYMDVIALHQAGYENVVSPMGTALSEHQLRALKRYSRNIVLALDPDAAGERAMVRGLTVAIDEGGETPTFDLRGLVRSEGRLDTEIRVVTLPAEKDPDEVVAEDPALWEGAIASARPVISHLIDVATEGKDLDDPKVKWEIARRVLPVVEEVSNPVEREAYRQALARRLMVDERAFMSWRPRYHRRGPRPIRSEDETEGPASTGGQAPLEGFCLGLLLRDPELLYRVDRQMQALELERLSSKDFTGTEGEVIFQAVRVALAQDEEEPAERWRKHLEEALIPIAEAMAAEASGLDLERPKVIEEVLASFLQLRKRNLDATLRRLRFQQQATQEEGEGEGAQSHEHMWHLTQEVHRLASQKSRLDQALARRQDVLRHSVIPEGR